MRDFLTMLTICIACAISYEAGKYSDAHRTVGQPAHYAAVSNLVTTNLPAPAASRPFAHLAPGCDFRIMTDGKRWFVQEHTPVSLAQWDDDIFGGYQPSYEAASNRVIELADFNKRYFADLAAKKKFKPAQ